MLRFIREPERYRVTGIERTTCWRLEKEGKFPKRHIISQNAVGWLEHEVQEWIKSRVEETNNTSHLAPKQRRTKSQTENTAPQISEEKE